MTTHPAWIRVDAERVADTLSHEAAEKLEGGEGEVVLDFSDVLRIDASAARALEELADLADPASIKVVLRAVNVDIYKVLKLLNLTKRFCILC